MLGALAGIMISEKLKYTSFTAAVCIVCNADLKSDKAAADGA